MILDFSKMEWTPDAPENTPGTLDQAQNVTPAIGGYEAIRGPSDVSTSGSIANACRGAFAAVRGGTKIDFYGDNVALYQMPASTTTISDITRTSGGAYSTSEFWDFAQFGEYVIAVNGGASGADTPQVFQIGTSSNFAALGGTPPNADTVAVVRDFVVMGGTYDATDGEKPGRVWWSAYRNHADWVPDPATQCDWQDLEAKAGKVQRILGGEVGLVICENACYRMTYEGPPTIFRFDEIPAIGTPAPMSCIRDGNTIYMLSNNGFIRMGLDGSVDPIGRGKFDQTFYKLSALNPGLVKFTVGSLDRKTGSACWLQKTSATDTDNDVFAYSTSFNQWTKWVFSEAVSFIYPSSLSDNNPEGMYLYDETDDEVKALIADTYNNPVFVGTNYIQPTPNARTYITEVWPLANVIGTNYVPYLYVYSKSQMNEDAETLTTLTAFDDDGKWSVNLDDRFFKFTYVLNAPLTPLLDDELKIHGLDVIGTTTSRY